MSEIEKSFPIGFVGFTAGGSFAPNGYGGIESGLSSPNKNLSVSATVTAGGIALPRGDVYVDSGTYGIGLRGEWAPMGGVAPTTPFVATGIRTVGYVDRTASLAAFPARIEVPLEVGIRTDVPNHRGDPTGYFRLGVGMDTTLTNYAFTPASGPSGVTVRPSASIGVGRYF